MQCCHTSLHLNKNIVSYLKGFHLTCCIVGGTSCVAVVAAGFCTSSVAGVSSVANAIGGGTSHRNAWDGGLGGGNRHRSRCEGVSGGGKRHRSRCEGAIATFSRSRASTWSSPGLSRGTDAAGANPQVE